MSRRFVSLADHATGTPTTNLTTTPIKIEIITEAPTWKIAAWSVGGASRRIWRATIVTTRASLSAWKPVPPARGSGLSRSSTVLEQKKVQSDTG